MLGQGRLAAGLVVVLTTVSWALLAGPANAAGVPTVISPPTISGTPQEGQTLTAVRGSWTNQPTGYAHHWLRCTSAGTGCVVISGATGKTYVLTAADVGHTIVVVEEAHNAAGKSAPARSAPTGIVSPAPSPSPSPSPPPPPSPATTVTTLVASPAAPVADQAVTLIAAVTSSDSSVSPSGTVTFLNGGTAISGCANEPASGAGQSVVVTCQTWFAASTQQLMATFSPNTGAALTGSTSAPVSLAVGRDTTSTTLDTSKTVGVGGATTYTATVGAPPGRLGTLRPTGTVEFLDGAQPIGSCLSRALTNAGATCSVTYGRPGNHSITAQYSGDGNFAASSAPAQSVTAVKLRPRVLGWVTATMQWTFDSLSTYTNVLTLVVNGASGATVTTSCHGGGCPFIRHATLVTKTKRCGQASTRSCPSHGALDLTSGFQNRRLSIGAQITVAITRPGWIGKYYQFTVRAQRRPQVRIACLAPGAVRPGSRC